MKDMSNQLLGVKTRFDSLNSQISSLQQQITALQNMAFEIDEDGNFMPPLVEIDDEEP